MKNKHKTPTESNKAPAQAESPARYQPFLRELAGRDIPGAAELLAENAIAAEPRGTPPPASNRPERRHIDRASRRRPRRSSPPTTREQRDQAHIARVTRSLNIPTGTRIIPRPAWIVAWHILADPTGRAAAHYLRKCSNKIAAGLIRRAALAVDDRGRARYTWTDPRARRVAALAVGMLYMQKATAKTGRWQGFISGVPIGAFAALLRDPYTGRRPSFNALTGTHLPTGNYQNGGVGYLTALRQVRFVYTQQLPPSQVRPFERAGPSGYAVGRHWIVTADPRRPVSEPEKARLLTIYRQERETLKREKQAESGLTVYGDAPRDQAAPAAAPRAPP